MCASKDKSTANEPPKNYPIKVPREDKQETINVPLCIDENKKLGKLDGNDWTDDGAITCEKGATLDLKLSD